MMRRTLKQAFRAPTEAEEIRLLAERQMGAFLKAMPKAKGGWESRGSEPEPQDAPTLAEIGITKKQSASAQKLADIPAEDRTPIR